MDEVFRALNDPSRRLLLDVLFADDGQPLMALCEHLPDMTRFGVMNHLSVLEEANLVTTRKVGRRKLHYLNAVPIRLVHDRWISKYTEPVIGALAAMKTHLEGGGEVDHNAEPSHVYEAYVRCEPEAAWNAVVDGNLTVQYFYGTRVESSWEPGTEIRYLDAEGNTVADGEILAFDPPRRVEMTFLARWDPDLEAEGPVRHAWIVEPSNGLTRVRVEYYDLPATSKRAGDFMQGIPLIMSGLKTLLETGEPLAVA